MRREEEIEQIKMLPPEVVLRHLGIPYRRQGSQIMALAVWRAESRPSVSIQISPKTGHYVWRDHGVPAGWPHAGGSWIDLVITAKGCSYPQAVRELRSLLYSLPQFSLLDDIDKANAAPPEAKILQTGRVTSRELRKYLHSRGILLHDLPDWLQEVHYSVSGRVYCALGIRTIRGGWQIRSPAWKGFLLAGGVALATEDGFASETIGDENIICV